MREILITKKGYFVCAKHPFLINTACGLLHEMDKILYTVIITILFPIHTLSIQHVIITKISIK